MRCRRRVLALLDRDERSRLRRAQYAAALVLAFVTFIGGAPILAGAASAPESIPVVGSCVFGTGSGNVLTASFSPRASAASGDLTTIAGTGSCTSNGSSNAVNLNLVLTGLWTCEGGEAAGSGTATWTDGIPPAKLVVVTAIGGPGEINVWLRDPTLRFEAWATLVWSAATTAAGCAASGGVSSTQLLGSMTYTAT